MDYQTFTTEMHLRLYKRIMNKIYSSIFSPKLIIMNDDINNMQKMLIIKILPPAGVPMLAPSPVIVNKNPNAGPIWSTSTKSAVRMDSKKPKTPEKLYPSFVS